INDMVRLFRFAQESSRPVFATEPHEGSTAFLDPPFLAPPGLGRQSTRKMKGAEVDAGPRGCEDGKPPHRVQDSARSPVIGCGFAPDDPMCPFVRHVERAPRGTPWIPAATSLIIEVPFARSNAWPGKTETSIPEGSEHARSRRRCRMRRSPPGHSPS